MEIFKRKRPTLKVVQVPGDGPFRRYRQWYSHFYMPRAQTQAIQAGANGVIETDGDYDAPGISSRSEERGVGNEWGCTCISRCSPYHYNKKYQDHTTNNKAEYA